MVAGGVVEVLSNDWLVPGPRVDARIINTMLIVIALFSKIFLLVRHYSNTRQSLLKAINELRPTYLKDFSRKAAKKTLGTRQRFASLRLCARNHPPNNSLLCKPLIGFAIVRRDP
jgi:hypothetical protein